MIEEKETFGGSWPWAPRYFSGRGFAHHYVDEGRAETGETFVCLHGEPTWGYLYRKFIPRLGELGRVVVPDHMGFGKSETPQDREYTAEEHCDNLEALLSIRVRDVTFVMQDWGGPIGSNFAFRHPDRVRRMFFIDSFPRAGLPEADRPGGPRRRRSDALADLLHESRVRHRDESPLLEHPLGPEADRLREQRRHRRRMDPRLRGALPDRGILQGREGLPPAHDEPDDLAYFEAAIDAPGALEAMRAKPAMGVIGAEDRTLPRMLAEGVMAEVWPNAPFVVLPGVGHYAQEDAPDTLVALIEQFVKAH